MSRRLTESQIEKNNIASAEKNLAIKELVFQQSSQLLDLLVATPDISQEHIDNARIQYKDALKRLKKAKNKYSRAVKEHNKGIKRRVAIRNHNTAVKEHKDWSWKP